MHYSSLIQMFLSKKRQDPKALALWDAAEPISFEEIKTELVAYSRQGELAKINPSDLNRALTLDDLWAIFESLEDIDDCRVIY